MFPYSFNEFMRRNPNMYAGVMTAGNMLRDSAVSLAHGAVDLGEAVVGVPSLLTGGIVGEGWGNLGYDPNVAHQELNKLYSEDTRKKFEKVSEAKGIKETIKAITDDFPTTVGYGTMRALPTAMAAQQLGNKIMPYGNKLVEKGQRAYFNYKNKGITLKKMIPYSFSPSFYFALGEGILGSGQQIESQRNDGRYNPYEAVTAGVGQAATSYAASGFIPTRNLHFERLGSEMLEYPYSENIGD